MALAENPTPDPGCISAPGYRVGLALSPNKVKSFLLPSLLHHAQHRGLHLLSLDLHKPLTEQGPFHCILHKLYSPHSISLLRDFISKHPDLPVIDSPDAVQRLRNRISMLQVVNHLPPLPHPNPTLTFGIPKHLVLNLDAAAAAVVVDAHSFPLKFPVIAKPLQADGSPTSHHMSLLFNPHGLSNLNSTSSEPMLLQEFVNHGGVLFKVYVAGKHVRCVKRPSFPDLLPSSLESLHLGEHAGILPLSRISNLPAPSDATLEAAEMPPLDFVHHLAQGLRQALNLHLFNFDMIRDASLTSPTTYFIIDINYFPGYAKLPGFESMFSDFLLDLLTPPNDNPIHN